MRAGAGGAQCRGDGRRVVAEADRVDLFAGAVKDGVPEADLPRLGVLAHADRDRVRVGVGGDDVKRLGGGDADPASLADGEVVVAGVAADRRPGGVEDGPGPLAQAAVALEKPRLALAGKEAEVLALGLLGDLETVTGRDLADLGLAQLGERESNAIEQSGR